MAFSAAKLTMDGQVYRVRVVYESLIREFELLEGVNAGDMLSFRHERDLGGTGYSMSCRWNPIPGTRKIMTPFMRR